MMFKRVLQRRELSQYIRNNKNQTLRGIVKNQFISSSSLNTTSNPTTTFYKSYSTIKNNIINNNNNNNKTNIPKKFFSTSEASDNLAHLISREIEDEETSGNNVLPKNLEKILKIIEKDWRIVDKSSLGYTTLYKKTNLDNGMKIAVQFHCQDTTNPDDEQQPSDLLGDDNDEDDENNEGNDEEENGSLRFMVSCNKGGKNVVIGCITEGGQAEVETVVVRDGDTVDEGFILRGTEHLYQGPEFYDLASDLQESFNIFLQDDCGVDETVSSFLVMYTDYKEQNEYVHWLKTIHGVVN